MTPAVALDMDIKLISQDAELLTTCRAILAEIAADSWTITAVLPHEVDSAANLCIWDFQPTFSIPEHVMGSPAKHLFLVRREDLDLFRAGTHAREANILLKPFTRVTLTAFLGMGLSVGSALLLAGRSRRYAPMPDPDQSEAAGIRPGPDELPGARRTRFPGAPDCHQRLLWLAAGRTARAAVREPEGSPPADAAQRYSAFIAYGLRYVSSSASDARSNNVPVCKKAIFAPASTRLCMRSGRSADEKRIAVRHPWNRVRSRCTFDADRSNRY